MELATHLGIYLLGSFVGVTEVPVVAWVRTTITAFFSEFVKFLHSQIRAQHAGIWVNGMVRYFCRGRVVDNVAEDRAKFVAEMTQQKFARLSFIYEHQHEVSVLAESSSAAASVLWSEDCMGHIFRKVHRPAKAAMAVACKRWAQLFLLREEAPGWNTKYLRTLRRRCSSGVTTITRDGGVVSRRCRCYLTGNMIARRVLHKFQTTGTDIAHLEVSDSTPPENGDDYFGNLPATVLNRASGIALVLLGTDDVVVID